MLFSPSYTGGHGGWGAGEPPFVARRPHCAAVPRARRVFSFLTPIPPSPPGVALSALPPNTGAKITLPPGEAPPHETRSVAAGTQGPLGKHEPLLCYRRRLLSVHTPSCPNSNFRSEFTLTATSLTCPRSCPKLSQSTDHRCPTGKRGLAMPLSPRSGYAQGSPGPSSL